MNRSSSLAALSVAMLTCIAIGGCRRAAAVPPPPPVPEVEVARPLVREVTDHEDFTGQTEAFRTIDIRARVTGYLDHVNFTEGAEVEAGTTLFEIDPRPYQAEFDRSKATVVQGEARLNRLEADLRRAEILHTKRTISDEEYERVVADRADAKAGIEAAKASLELSQLNLEFTKVTAPIRGRLSRQYIDPGNLVTGDETILTRIVSQDPMYVYFDIDERTMLRVRRLVLDSISTATAAPAVPVLMGLADEEGYPHRGKIDFQENRVDAGTGTLRVRGLFPNATRVLAPGFFVRIRLPIGEPYQAIVVPEQAVGTDQGQKFVYVVDDQNQVVYRRIKVGRLHEGYRVVQEGLKTSELVVVSGLQRVRPGAKVQIKPAQPAERSDSAANPADTKAQQP